ncbi:hypothetical protein J2X16_001186 [Pelomonas aquatica]|uniref:Orc1-like AAA ATPase domain-containing protein n=1 Tax=Pelomonas aquatica TaxID=431058 RepID=A0ABU1Z5G9_9BURK|nr:hypothetical protein [Pelomonas aquatica]MDR7295847.1 hypothetical protein [Pelomonas aquatica]
MADYFFRTEDIRPEDVETYFVETKRDREIINALKARNPIILSGSRGVGKSFLLRVAESELLKGFAENRVLPVYVSFNRSSLINTTDPQQFQHWMLARICARTSRTLKSSGLINLNSKAANILSGESKPTPTDAETAIEKLSKSYEESWKEAQATVDLSSLPSLDDFRDAIEDICTENELARIVVLIDEAAHILIPEQQRQFFTLFRDLRSPYIACKAAVYPGVTTYGETFQPSHDATMLSFDRDILGIDYVDTMREIVVKQAESSTLEDIARHDKNFSLLAFASTGNPRVLLKTLARAPRLTATQTNEVLREYYRSDLWAEHSTLPEKYAGHRHLIDWGRKFIEGTVLPDLKRKNEQYIEREQKSTCFFWVHRDAPQPVKEALKLLAYSGIVSEHAIGIKATRGEVGTRYSVNLGALLSLESLPTSTGLPIARGLFPARMSEFGANHPAYQSLLSDVPTFSEPAVAAVLQQQLNKPLDVLDITPWQQSKLKDLGLNTIGDVLIASETQLQSMSYVGEKRSRRIRNAALAAVFEYLSG